MITPANGMGLLRFVNGRLLLVAPSDLLAVLSYETRGPDDSGIPACYLTMPTLLVDSTTTPYANRAAAEAALASQEYGTRMEYKFDPTYITSTSKSLSISGKTLSFSMGFTGSDTGSGYAIVLSNSLFSVNATAAAGIDVYHNLYSSGGGLPTGTRYVTVFVYESDGSTLVGSTTKSDGKFTTYAPGSANISIPADGKYFVLFEFFSRSTTIPLTALYAGTVGSTGAIDFCGVRAEYTLGAGTAFINSW